MRTAIIENLDDLDTRAWREMLDDVPDATVFQELGWLRAWWSTCAPPDSRLHVIVATGEHGLLGAAPFYVHAGESGRAPSLRYVGSPHSDYNVVLSRGNDRNVLSLLLDQLERAIPRHGVLALHDLPERSVTATAFAARVTRFGKVATRGRTPCPRLDLSDRAHAADVFRKSGFRRHARRLATLGEVQVQHLTEASAISARLPDFFDQHVRRWSTTADPSLFESAHNRRFYEAVVEQLASSGSVVFTVVAVAGTPVAYHFGLRSRGDLLWYKPSYDITFASHSPGQAMLYELVRWCVETGSAGLDFTRGDEAFKARLANEVHMNASFVVHASAADRLIDATRRLGAKVARRARAIPARWATRTDAGTQGGSA